MVEAPSPAAAEAEGPAPAAKGKKKDKGEDDDDEDHDDGDMTDEQKEAMIKTREAWPLERKCVYALCVGLTNGRVIWSGDATTDFVFFLEQSHVILSIFRSHRRHPMRMWQRIAFLYCTMCLAFTSSVYIANNFVQSTNMYSDGWYYGAVIVSAIIAVLYQMLLVHIAICPCFRRRAIAPRHLLRIVCRPLARTTSTDTRGLRVVHAHCRTSRPLRSRARARASVTTRRRWRWKRGLGRVDRGGPPHHLTSRSRGRPKGGARHVLETAHGAATRGARARGPGMRPTRLRARESDAVLFVGRVARASHAAPRTQPRG